jgi:hypothetical protein
VGTESDVVTAVISLTERVDSREVRARLGEALPAAMRLRAVRPLAEKGRKAVLQPDWETALVQVESAMTVGNLDGALAAFLAQPEILVVRRREGTEETFDARPEIRSLRIVEVAEKDRATSAGSSASTFRLKVRVGRGIPALAPEDLAAAFLEHLGGGRILRARQTGLGRKARAGRRKHPGEASVGPPDTGAAGQARPGGKFPEPIRAETTRGHARLEVL